MKRLVPYLFFLGLSTQLDLDFCHQQLGAAVGGGLEDSAFSASSSYDEASVGPRNARLNGDGNGGAWCSATPVSREMGSKEWIEVDLGSMHVITAVWTQGRFGNGRGAEFTEAYKLQYWRPSMTDFVEYRDSMGRTVLPGNENTYTVVNNTLQPPILAWKIRLLPFSEHPRTPCVRLEYVGCPLTEGVVSYSIPQGMVRGSFELMDHTYDGKEDSRTGELRGGLGQLVDGRYGYDNFKTGKGSYLKGYDWIGWKRKSNQASVNLLFAFDCVRTFQRVDLHVDNHFSKDIQVFKQAKLYFSNEEDKFGDDRGVTFNYMPDLAIEKKRNVSINLKGEHGKYIMLQLYFNAKWILISEVTFFSKPRQEKPFRVKPDSKEATQTLPKNEPGLANHRPIETTASANGAEEVEVAPIDIDIKSFEAADPDGRKARGDTSGPRPNSDSIGLVIGSLLTVILLLLMGILLMVHRSRVSKEKRATPTHSLLTTSSKSHPDRFNLSLAATAAPVSDQVIHYTPYSHINGGSKSYEETIYEEPFSVVPRYLSTDDLTDEYAEPGMHLSHSLSENIYSQAVNNGPAQSTRDGHGLPPLPLSHYARPGSPPLELPPPPPPTYEPVLVTRHSKREKYRPPSPRQGNGSHSGSSSSSSNTPHGRYPPLTTLPSSRRRSSRSSRSSSTLKKNESIDLSKLYAQVEKTNAHPEKLHPFKRSTSIDTVNVKLSELDMSHLEMVEQLGEGQFGEIHLCRLRHPLPLAHDRDQERASTEARNMVAVKFLRPDCDEMTRSDFEHEARILTSLSDVNLVRVLGVGYRSDAPEELEAMVCEYTSLGDLCQFLDAHVAETTLSKSPNVPTLSYGSLIYMATQIASGMTYLESLNFVHRDLAARNCIVGPRKSVKICDLGMSRPMYKDDYYKTESGCQLPIRWMSWESVLLGKFTTKSDVWSFGVTLWEILTFAREQPYESQSDAKVLSNLSNMWRDGRPSLVLSSPRGCSREVRDLMIECWQKAEDERPTFQEIHLFLQRKNLGYDPQ